MQPTIMTRPGEHELRRLGYEVTVSGDLARLRATTRLTKNTHARMLGVSIAALNGYESMNRAVSRDVALRIGEWYWGATTALAQALADGVPIHTMVPAAQAAQYLNWSQDVLEATCAKGIINAELVGVMGWYLPADELPGLTAHLIAKGRAPVTV